MKLFVPAAKIICSLVLVFATLSLSSCARTRLLTGRSPETIKVGALLAMSGELGSSGQGESLALDLAIGDVNDFLEKKKASFRLVLVRTDTGTHPETALTQLQELTDQGVRMFIGPDSSEETFRVLPWANWFDRILISPASTAPSLAIEDDNLFRMIPDDSHQAAAMASLVWKNGHRILIPCYRDDQYANDLVTAMKVNLTMLGGTMMKGLRYPCETNLFDATVSRLAGNVSDVTEQYGTAPTAVYLVSFEEAAQLMQSAADKETLHGVRWYGNESLALNRHLLQDPKAATFAAERAFVCPEYYVPDRNANAVVEELKTQTGNPPEAFALAAYDALWLIAKTYLEAGPDADVQTLKQTLPAVAKEHTGVTGPCTLNSAGDRARGDYRFWQVEEQGDGPAWVQLDYLYRE